MKRRAGIWNAARGGLTRRVGCDQPLNQSLVERPKTTGIAYEETSFRTGDRNPTLGHAKLDAHVLRKQMAKCVRILSVGRGVA